MGNKEKCLSCNQDYVRETDPGKQNVEFIFEGFNFLVRQLIYECSECAQKNAISIFQEYGAKFIKLQEGEIKVNWANYRNEKEKPILLDILGQLGILSSQKEGNWIIIGEGMDINPSRSGRHYYFTREEDAIGYSQKIFYQTTYQWELCHIDKVIPKRQLIKEK